ncbi:unnamed protein product [Ranitomeya imitator]|uniref:Tetraspanin n=1 Tax=Ranitomeya imitator TaxID=111125 RepID=A0ABN9LXP6_9NEOB|nr:unnamed protein product [Ranitomeya imitator]
MCRCTVTCSSHPLAGGTLLGVGIWVSVDSGSFLKIFGTIPNNVATQFVNVGYFLIAIGALLLILGFLGCCGAQKESKCLLITAREELQVAHAVGARAVAGGACSGTQAGEALQFFCIVLIIFIAEVAGAVVALVYSSVAESFLTSVLTPVLQKDYGENKDVTKIWDNMMSELKCCGLSNYSDFNNSTFVQSHGQYPEPCCNTTSTHVHYADGTGQPQTGGCMQQIVDLLKSNAAIVGGVAAGICALELAAMVVSMYLYCKIDKEGSIH